MKVKKYLCVIIVSIIIIILSGLVTFIDNKTNEINVISNISPVGSPVGMENDHTDISLNSSPVPTPYPKPAYKPEFRPYRINKEHDIWHAQEPMSYITPQNGWVRYYASQLYIDYDGRIRYKNTKVPWLSSEDGRIVLWIDKPFINNYQSDDDQFNYNLDVDVWVTPDYYLTNGMSDDCDGWAVTVVSLLLSGELSVKQNEYFIKQIIPAKVVLGYVSNYRDAWVEYNVYNKTFYTSTSLVNIGIDGKEKASSTTFMERNNKTLMPVFEFTDEYFGKYKSSN